MSNKFFHDEAVEQAKKQEAKQNKQEAFKKYVEDSLSGVYETFNKLSAKLDAKMAQIQEFGSEVERALSSLQEEIIELNQYLKKTREEVRKMKFKNRVRDVLSVGQFLVVLALLLLILTGCSTRSTVIYGHKPHMLVTDAATNEVCGKVYTSISQGEMTHAYANPCNVKITFKNKKGNPY